MKELQVNASDVLIAWNCIAAVMQSEELDEEEAKLLFEVLDTLAEQHRKSTKPYNIKLKLDHFKAIWHSINACREKDIIPEEKDISTWAVFAKVADLIDKDLAFNTQPEVLLEQ